MPPDTGPRRSARIAANQRADENKAAAVAMQAQTVKAVSANEHSVNNKAVRKNEAAILDSPDHISALPVEVLVKIAGHLADELPAFSDLRMGLTCNWGTWEMAAVPTDILSLSMVSKRFNGASQPALYTKVYIRSNTQLQRLHRTLIGNANLYRLIQHIYVCTFPCNRPACTRKSRLASFYPGLSNSNRHDAAPPTDALAEILTGSINTQKLVLNLQSCPGTTSIIGYVTRITLGNNHNSFPSFLAGLCSPVTSEKALLPRLNDLYVVEKPWDNIAVYMDLFSNPSLRNVHCLENFHGRWYDMRAHAPETGYPNITSLVVYESAACPTDISAMCELFPSLVKLEIETGGRKMMKRVEEVTSEVSAATNLSHALSKLKDVEKVALKTHWGALSRSSNTSQSIKMLGPSGGLTTLAGLNNLTTLEIGMHLIMVVPPSATHIDEYHTSDYLRPASVLPPGLRRLTLYHCTRCSDIFRGWATPRHSWERPEKFLWLSFISELALAKANGSFEQLEAVKFISDEPQWLSSWNGLSPFREERLDRNGEAWYPGLFLDSADLFQSHGVEFRASRVHSFEC